jgi:hypothetical protein
MLLTTFAILGSYSRGGLIGLSIVGISLIAQAKRRLLITFCALAVVVGGLALLPEEWYARMQTIESYDRDSFVEGRFEGNSQSTLPSTTPLPAVGSGPLTPAAIGKNT